MEPPKYRKIRRGTELGREKRIIIIAGKAVNDFHQVDVFRIIVSVSNRELQWFFLHPSVACNELAYNLLVVDSHSIT